MTTFLTTPLDRQETPVDSRECFAKSDSWSVRAASEVAFRHSGWQRHRLGIINAFEEADVSESRISRFVDCGSVAWVLHHVSDPTRVKLSGSFCHDRFCLPCQQARSRRLAAAVYEALPKQAIRFLTLTTRSDSESLSVRLDHLLSSFRRLRQHKFWKTHVTGGIAFVEVKRNKANTGWHPHLHVLILGDFVPKDELREAWRKATRGSFVIDIRLVTDRSKAAQYVTKYASKPMSYAKSNDPLVMVEAIDSLKGRRLVIPFGCLKGVRVTDGDEDNGEWLPLAPLWRVIRNANAGDVFSIRILATLNRSTKGGASCQVKDSP